MDMKRREFIGSAVAGAAGVLVGEKLAVAAQKKTAAPDVNPTALVPLGKALKCCRIGSGTGMRGGGRQTNQRAGRRRC